jgi:hypothetical protein
MSDEDNIVNIDDAKIKDVTDAVIHQDKQAAIAELWDVITDFADLATIFRVNADMTEDETRRAWVMLSKHTNQIAEDVADLYFAWSELEAE